MDRKRTLHTSVDLRQPWSDNIVPTAEQRPVVQNAIIIEIDARYGIHGITTVEENDRGQLEAVDPLQRWVSQMRLVKPLADEVVAQIVIGIAEIAAQVGGVADRSAFAQIVRNGVGPCVRSLEEQSCAEPLLQVNEQGIVIGVRAGLNQVDLVERLV